MTGGGGQARRTRFALPGGDDPPGDITVSDYLVLSVLPAAGVTPARASTA
jgi:hypothetical protein